MMDTKEPALLLKSISKSFSGVQVLDNVDLSLCPGEVHVLVGENGAGKSTLMKILAGAYQQDSGSIIIDGKIQTKWSPSIARSKGVGMVYQEFNLLPYRSVAENVFLGKEELKYQFILNKKKMYQLAAEQLEEIGIKVDTRSVVRHLGVAQQQMVEIAKALLCDVRFLVLDEPTSALTFFEIDRLFETINRLKSKGVGIIYISHKMGEGQTIGDRITVLRDGKRIDTLPIAESSTDKIIKMMIGREIKDLFPRHFTRPGEVALKINGINTKNKLKDVSLDVRFGEIVGLTGLMGAGRTEVARAIFGLDQRTAGDIEVNGTKVHNIIPSLAIKKGLGYVSEDRKREGIFKNLGIMENILMSSLGKYFNGGILKRNMEISVAEKFIKSLSIHPPNLKKRVQYLSGGNQQKVIMARWLAMEPRILILDEPTRGVDVGSKTEIHTLIDKLANEGNAILMISSELPEILGMSDRIYVMRDGAIAGEFDRNADSEQLIRCAMGEQECRE
jgi:ABC-type sugar transport system ATPase subunit